MNLLFLAFVFPLLGFLILAFGRGKIPETLAAVVGVGSIGLSALVTAIVGVQFLQHPPAGDAYVQPLWTWMQVGGFAPQFALRLDGLSLTMMGVITGVGFLIHLFASWYMRGDEGYGRFFSYMNLFIASMLFLVLGDNLLFLYFGWEGVGLCSYLLIGFWYQDPANGTAARKAFIVTRVGDTFMAIGLFLLFETLGTLNIQEILQLAPQAFHPGGFIVTLIALLLAGFTALVQTDIKRVLAYSTMSQIGYMFLALGAGAWSAAIFHLMTHAFFKALLFLASGAVILACHHEQDIRKMGGLRKKIPLAYWCFMVGGSALCALPLITAGYYSKDEILWQAYASGHIGLFIAGLFGAFLTSLYTFRLIFTVFYGEAKTDAHAGHGVSYWLPLSVLLVLSTVVGGLIHPPLENVLPANPAIEGGGLQHQVAFLSGAVAIAGIAIAGWLFFGQPRLVLWLEKTAPAELLRRFWFSAFGFDWLYDRLFVKPFLWAVRVNSKDVFDQIIGTIPVLLTSLNKATALSQSGRLRWYTASMACGAVLIIAAMVYL